MPLAALNAPPVDKQLGKAGVGPRIFRARDGMRRYKVHGLRQMRGHITHDCALHRTDIGNDGTGSEVRTDLPCDRTTCADGDANDDEIGALSRRGIGLYDLIGKTELGDAPARLRRPRRGYDRAYRALRTLLARSRSRSIRRVAGPGG